MFFSLAKVFKEKSGLLSTKSWFWGHSCPHLTQKSSKMAVFDPKSLKNAQKMRFYPRQKCPHKPIFGPFWPLFSPKTGHKVGKVGRVRTLMATFALLFWGHWWPLLHFYFEDICASPYKNAKNKRLSKKPSLSLSSNITYPIQSIRQIHEHSFVEFAPIIWTIRIYSSQ